MVCLLFVGSFIGDAAPAALPHRRLCTVYPAQSAFWPLFQAHRFPFQNTLRLEEGQP